jgi:hypothetical protein
MARTKLQAGKVALADKLDFDSLSTDTESARQRVTLTEYGSTAVNMARFDVTACRCLGDSGMGGAVITVRCYDASSGGTEVAQFSLTLTSDTYSQTEAIAPTLFEAGCWVSAESDTAGDLDVTLTIQGPAPRS